MPDTTENIIEADVVGNIEKICGDIDSFLGNEAEFSNLSQKYIKNRLLELKEEPPSPEELRIEFDNHNGWNGFMHENTKIFASGMWNGFVLDDDNIYTELLGVMHDMRNNSTWADDSAKSMSGQAVGIAVRRYFDNTLSNDSAPVERRHIYNNNSGIGIGKSFSIKEFKGKASAECIEKASVGNNLFCFLGFDSSLIISTHTKIRDGMDDPHAYLYVNDGKVRRIVDLTNPSCTFDANDKLLSTQVAVYKLSDEQQALFESGESITIQHNDYIVNEDGSKTPKSSARMYSRK